MATVKLYVEDGEFNMEKSYVVYGESFSKKEMTANGWTAKIDKKGKIVCDAVREYANGISSMRYTIFPTGYARLTLVTEGGKPKTIKEGYIIKKGQKLEGIIGLSGGKIEDRYAYFRDAEFINFLKDNQLHGVIRVSPDREYLLRECYLASGKKDEKIFTDGEATEVDTRYREDIPEGSCCYDIRRTVEVKNATWAILRDKKTGWGYLYTLEKNVMAIDFK